MSEVKSAGWPVPYVDVEPEDEGTAPEPEGTESTEGTEPEGNEEPTNAEGTLQGDEGQEQGEGEGGEGNAPGDGNEGEGEGPEGEEPEGQEPEDEEPVEPNKPLKRGLRLDPRTRREQQRIRQRADDAARERELAQKSAERWKAVAQKAATGELLDTESHEEAIKAAEEADAKDAEEAKAAPKAQKHVPTQADRDFLVERFADETTPEDATDKVAAEAEQEAEAFVDELVASAPGLVTAVGGCLYPEAIIRRLGQIAEEDPKLYTEFVDCDVRELTRRVNHMEREAIARADAIAAEREAKKAAKKKGGGKMPTPPEKSTGAPARSPDAPLKGGSTPVKEADKRQKKRQRVDDRGIVWSPLPKMPRPSSYDQG